MVYSLVVIDVFDPMTGEPWVPLQHYLQYAVKVHQRQRADENGLPGHVATSGGTLEACHRRTSACNEQQPATTSTGQGGRFSNRWAMNSRPDRVPTIATGSSKSGPPSILPHRPCVFDALRLISAFVQT